MDLMLIGWEFTHVRPWFWVVSHPFKKSACLNTIKVKNFNYLFFNKIKKLSHEKMQLACTLQL